MEQVIIIGVTHSQLLEEFRGIVRAEIASQVAVSEKPELLDADGAAKLLGVCRQTIFDYRKRNLFPSHRIGGRTLFKRSELLNAVKSFTNG